MMSTRTPRYRLLALDIDGTLLNSAGDLLESTCEAVARAARSGVRPVLCTGRRYRRTAPIAAALGLEAPLVCNSGAVVKAPDGYATLHRADFPAGVAARVLEVFDAHGYIPLSFRDGDPDGADFRTAADPAGEPLLDEYLFLNRPHGLIDPRWRERIDDEPHFHLATFGSRPRMLELQREVHRALGDSVQTFVQKSPSFSGFSCEVLRGDANKWSAVRRLAREWGIADGEIIAIGDDMNDIPMILGAGLGVAMGHAPEEVRRVADHVTGDHDQDGVTEAIERILLAS
jgi:Cof subfamily protein (haloacid dehalogenase superfamily)